MPLTHIVAPCSVEGISVVATVVETLCYTVIIGYNWNNTYPVSSYGVPSCRAQLRWLPARTGGPHMRCMQCSMACYITLDCGAGDVFACWIQNAMLCATIAYYRRPPPQTVAVSALLFVIMNWWIISGACGMSILVGLQVCVSIVMSLGARMPQIWLNFRRGNTGELSILTFALSSVGNLIRVYTTAVLTSDMLLVFGTASQFLLNGIITAQCIQTEMANRRLKNQSQPST